MSCKDKVIILGAIVRNGQNVNDNKSLERGDSEGTLEHYFARRFSKLAERA